MRRNSARGSPRTVNWYPGAAGTPRAAEPHWAAWLAWLMMADDVDEVDVDHHPIIIISVDD